MCGTAGALRSQGSPPHCLPSCSSPVLSFQAGCWRSRQLRAITAGTRAQPLGWAGRWVTAGNRENRALLRAETPPELLECLQHSQAVQGSEASTRLWSRGWEALPPPLSCFPVIPQPCRAAATGGSAAQRGRGDIGESGWRHPGEMPCLAGSEHRPGGVGGLRLRAAPGAVLGSHTPPSTSSCFPWAARLEACEALQMSPATEGPPWSSPKAAGIRFCI